MENATSLLVVVFAISLSGCSDPTENATAVVATDFADTATVEYLRSTAKQAKRSLEKMIKGTTLGAACPRVKEREDELARRILTAPDEHPDVVSIRLQLLREYNQCAVDLRQYSGNWLEQDGAIYCNGYLTRFADEDYCSAEVPDDWVPFSFNGDEYYYQPLIYSD